MTTAPDSLVAAIPARVTVVDVDMPFGSMVSFIIKWTLASIPALLMLMIIGAVFAAVFAGLFAGLVSAIR